MEKNKSQNYADKGIFLKKELAKFEKKEITLQVEELRGEITIKVSPSDAKVLRERGIFLKIT